MKTLSWREIGCADILAFKAESSDTVSQKGKTRIAIYIDNDALDAFRRWADAAGSGYQTMINEVLRQQQHLQKSPQLIDVKVLRKMIREELKRAAHD